MRFYICACAEKERGGGIYRYRFDGKCAEQEAYFSCDRPMYAVRQGGKLHVLLRGEEGGCGRFFTLHKDLKEPTAPISSRGTVPCHLAVGAAHTYMVNYLSGNVVREDGVLHARTGKGVHPVRQEAPHTHFVGFTPDGLVAVADLGTDTLAFYDKELKLTSEAKVPAGHGIRHFVFARDGRYIYAVNELIPSVSVFAYGKGHATYLSTLPLAGKHPACNGAAIRLSADGRYLYVSLRKENVLCTLRAEEERLTDLSRVSSGGDSPRDFDILAGGFAVICNECSNNVVIKPVVNSILSPETVCEIPLPGALCTVI